MRGTLKYFTGSLWFTVICLALGGVLGWREQGTVASVVQTVFIVALLGVLETSLSFDNAVVNATVMRDMSPIWRHRFLTWGMAFAVFGMRFVFPLAVVSVVAKIGPIETVRLAAFDPNEYARLLQSAHVSLGAFGGAFLAMVCLKYFFDAEKEVHWIAVVERQLSRLGKFEAVELGLMMVVLYGFSKVLPPEKGHEFLVAGIFGLITYIGVDAIGEFMKPGVGHGVDPHQAGLAGFLYLNVLDATFSFDGVIGAFALTKELFVIALGLGVGAMFVRSLTILLVDRGTLESYAYLEHGAFWAVGALAAFMLVGTVVHVPEVVTGLVGGVLIGASFWSSIRYRRLHAPPAPAPARSEGHGGRAR